MGVLCVCVCVCVCVCARVCRRRKGGEGMSSCTLYVKIVLASSILKKKTGE